MQLANPLHRLVGTDEFASCSLKNLRLAAAQQAKGSGGIIRQSLEPGIPVHIQDAAEGLEVPDRTDTGAIRCVVNTNTMANRAW